MLAERRGRLDRPVSKPLFALILAFFLGVGIDQITPMPLKSSQSSLVMAWLEITSFDSPI